MDIPEISDDLAAKQDTAQRVAPRNLDDLLAPSSAESFLGSQFGKTFAIFPGEPGRFSALFPWSQLNRVLRQHRFDFPRLRLVMLGKEVPAPEFLSYESSSRRRGPSVPRINQLGLTRRLQLGATLILDGVHEVYEPLSTLTASLESLFRVHIQANLYAGWRTSPGFNVHWDDHDVIIVQVSGQKQWKVYGMTRPFPLERDVEPNIGPPETPAWEGVLNDGDALYIPRGWWHVASPMDGPTLHLTIGILNSTGADLLSWFTERLRANDDVRRDLPRFGQQSERAAYMERLCQTFKEECKPSILDEFFAHRDACISGRLQFGFPWSATEQVLPESGFLKWTSPIPASIESSIGSTDFSIACAGRKWRFAEGARPILERLLDRIPHAISELQSLGTDPDLTLIFLRELVSHGLLSVAESTMEQ
jgi:hypothetical protein